MAPKWRRTSSFFKVLIGDFDTRLKIPPSFLPHFKTVPKSCFLRCGARNASRRVGIEQENGGFYFKQGWNEFVKKHCLETTDFLVFKLFGNATFDVEIYGKNGCLKDRGFSLEKKIREKGLKTQTKEKQEAEDQRGITVKSEPKDDFEAGRSRNGGEKSFIRGDPAFAAEDDESWGSLVSSDEKGKRRMKREEEGHLNVKKKDPFVVCDVKAYHKYYMWIPKTFAREAKLTNKTSTVLKDEKGKLWRMGIKLNHPTGRVDFSKGWAHFRKQNNLKDGDKCLFRFIRGKIWVRILRSK